MSFDLFVWHARTRTTPAEAQAQYEHLAEGEPELEPADESVEVGRFLEQLSAKFPDRDACDDDAVDDCPWASGFERGDRHVFFNIRWTRAEGMAPIVIDLALHHGLSCYDPQQEIVHQPEGLPAKQ